MRSTNLLLLLLLLLLSFLVFCAVHRQFAYLVLVQFGVPCCVDSDDSSCLLDFYCFLEYFNDRNLLYFRWALAAYAIT